MPDCGQYYATEWRSGDGGAQKSGKYAGEIHEMYDGLEQKLPRIYVKGGTR